MSALLPSPDPGWFPMMLRLAGARCLVVGGGEIAINKLRLLLAHEAAIEIVARELDPEIQGWVDAGRLRVVGNEADDATLRRVMPGCRLVYVATDERATNRAAAALARAFNIPVCAVDDPDPSTFITPAQVHRGAVRIAISTGGAAPVLARRLRERVESAIPAGLGNLSLFMQRERARVGELCPDTQRRRWVWEAFIDGPGGAAASDGDLATAREILDDLLRGIEVRGEVWLIGAGPGDPDLLTLRALQLMQNADAVLYDQLVPAAILDRVRRDAERLFVGKQRSRHSVPQDQINAELVRRARAGQRVVRLKGGDPFIFGRGGEEIEALLADRIPFKVVPGITAASGCAAYGGIPLTHRDCAQSCMFVTGHARADGVLDLPWSAMAARSQTVVIYMGVGAMRMLCDQLVAHGLAADWPAAIVERGTRPDQRVLTGTLTTLPELAEAHGVASPALVIVGEVVRHRVISPDARILDAQAVT